jgi:hypothetical protein
VKKSPKKGDAAQKAWAVVQQATSEESAAAESEAVVSGRKGGKIGGKVRASRMTPDERSEAARKAVNARWAKSRQTRKGI